MATGNAVAIGSILLPLIAVFILVLVSYLTTDRGMQGLPLSVRLGCHVQGAPHPSRRSRMFLRAAHSRAE